MNQNKIRNMESTGINQNYIPTQTRPNVMNQNKIRNMESTGINQNYIPTQTRPNVMTQNNPRNMESTIPNLMNQNNPPNYESTGIIQNSLSGKNFALKINQNIRQINNQLGNNNLLLEPNNDQTGIRNNFQQQPVRNILSQHPSIMNKNNLLQQNLIPNSINQNNQSGIRKNPQQLNSNNPKINNNYSGNYMNN